MHLFSARLLRNQTVIGTSDLYSFVHVFQRIRTFSPERTQGTPPGSTMAGMKPSITPVNPNTRYNHCHQLHTQFTSDRFQKLSLV